MLTVILIAIRTLGTVSNGLKKKKNGGIGNQKKDPDHLVNSIVKIS